MFITIFLIINFFINYAKSNTNLVSKQNLIQNNIVDSIQIEKDNITTIKENQEENWYIQIDKISLKAPIREGTDKETLDNYVGHFENTQKSFGNICLAAHNRGYKNNYFARIKELKNGDEIKYIYEKKETIYIVAKHGIIENTDWSNLENTKEDRITLITCVENQPQYRRCIQAIKK